MAEIRSKTAEIIRGFFILIFICCICSNSVFAQSQPKSTPKSKSKSAETDSDAPPRAGTKMMVSGKSLHLSCNRSLRDLKHNRLECFGNVYIRRPSELLTSDYAILDMETEQLHAEGNVVYFTPDTVIYSAKMDYNFVTGTGMIEDGRVESDKYQLLGDKIERISDTHFRTTDGEYTTCRDCPASWRLVGRTIDLQVNGYAKLSHVFIKINDAPTIYMPYAIIPVKTQRQSGLLFPRFQQGPNGFSYIQPYFWAISRSMDTTLSAGILSQKGIKGEAQYRYVLTPDSQGQLDAFYLRDRQFIRDPYFHRWALNYKHNLALPWQIDQKLNYLDASDRDYARKFGDIPGQGEPGLISEAGLSKSGRDVSVWVNAKRIRNNLTVGFTEFDRNTVQLLPSVSVATADHRIFDDLPLYWGASVNYSRFWRVAPSFDAIYPRDYSPPSSSFFLETGDTPLRRAQRFNLVPELYYAAKIGDYLEIVPSLQYRSYYYLFDQGAAPPTMRGYLLAQSEISTTVERVYDGSFKHKFRPSLTYSNIPTFSQNGSHPFIRQLKTSGFQFDDNDIVPISSDTQLYFVPLGNSLSYQLGNKLIFKDGPTYKRTIDLTAGQSINFIEFRKPSVEKREPFSRFFTMLTVETLRFQANGTYFYYPYIKQPTYSLSGRYIFASYTRRLLSFERSLNLHYNFDQVISQSSNIGGTVNFSINDYFAVNGGLEYIFPITRNDQESPGVIQSINAGLTYQSPSQCYKINLTAGWTFENRKVAISWNLPLNLTGDGFSNLQEGGGVVPPGR